MERKVQIFFLFCFVLTKRPTPCESSPGLLAAGLLAAVAQPRGSHCICGDFTGVSLQKSPAAPQLCPAGHGQRLPFSCRVFWTERGALRFLSVGQRFPQLQALQMLLLPGHMGTVTWLQGRQHGSSRPRAFLAQPWRGTVPRRGAAGPGCAHAAWPRVGNPCCISCLSGRAGSPSAVPLHSAGQ